MSDAIRVWVALALAAAASIFLWTVVKAADAPMPQTLVIVVCKTLSDGPPDQNATSTGSENLKWDLSEGKYHCRPIELPVEPVAELFGQQAEPWSPMVCMRTAMQLGPAWDQQNRKSKYRFRWVACPTPIHASKDPSSPIIGWAIPGCPYMDGKVECEVDNSI